LLHIKFLEAGTKKQGPSLSCSLGLLVLEAFLCKSKPDWIGRKNVGADSKLPAMCAFAILMQLQIAHILASKVRSISSVLISYFINYHKLPL
jgi:hypothetical protein